MNYAQLKAAIVGWTKRSDMGVITPTLVQLAEARIARDFRLRSQITFSTITATAGTAALPGDFLEFKALVYADCADPLTAGTVEQVLNDRAKISGYRPKFYAVTGTDLQFGPIPDSSYTLNAAYYARLPALSADADTNWLLTNNPGIYLWAALAESAPWMQDDPRVGVWEGKYAQDKAQLVTADKAAEYSGTGLQISNTYTQEVV